MKRLIIISIYLLWLMGILFFILTIGNPYAQAEEYIIASYGGQVITIEHDGIIHAFGRGIPDTLKEEDGNNEDKEQYILLSQSDNNLDYYKEKAELREEAALRTNKHDDYYMAAFYYNKAGNEEKAKEMAEKEIELLVAQGTCGSYHSAAITARDILGDKELAEFYEQKSNEVK